MTVPEPPIDSTETRSHVLSFLNEPIRSVSSIYTSYVRPFVEIGGPLSDFLISPEELRRLPPNVVKIRMHLYQIFVRLDLCAQSGVPDPLPDESYQQISLLIRSISALAFALGSKFLLGLLTELRTVHFDRFPQTIQRIEDDLGVSDKEPTFPEPKASGKRTHYRDSPEKPKALGGIAKGEPHGGLLRGRQFGLEQTVKVRIKKSHHGPKPDDVKPMSFQDK
jgi:hypothetical protein